MASSRTCYETHLKSLLTKKQLCGYEVFESNMGHQNGHFYDSGNLNF